jgi:hypothetical protein
VGYIFAIVPHKDRTFDKSRTRTTLDELIERHATGLIPRPEQGHCSVWITEDLVELTHYLGWTIVEETDVDDKVNNGFTIIIRK